MFGEDQETGHFNCVLSRHAPTNTESFNSPWDVHKLVIRKHMIGLIKNAVYLVICSPHDNSWYIGSSDNVGDRAGF